MTTIDNEDKVIIDAIKKAFYDKAPVILTIDHDGKKIELTAYMSEINIPSEPPYLFNIIIDSFCIPMAMRTSEIVPNNLLDKTETIIAIARRKSEIRSQMQEIMAGNLVLSIEEMEAMSRELMVLEHPDEHCRLFAAKMIYKLKGPNE